MSAPASDGSPISAKCFANSSDDIHAYRGSAAEVEASAFSAALLMPGALFRPMLQEGTSIPLVCRLSDHFRTTLTATAVRLVEETPEDCYVVFSRNSRILWWRRREHGSGFWLERNRLLSPNSRAWACDTTPTDARGMERVPTDAWFEGQRDAEGAEVWEESVLLREYDTVLTLLCVI